MSFDLYLAVATVVVLLVLWAVHAFLRPEGDDQSFAMFMLDPSSRRDPQFQMIALGLVALAAGIGTFVIN